jgi:hypothetical protein
MLLESKADSREPIAGVQIYHDSLLWGRGAIGSSIGALEALSTPEEIRRCMKRQLVSFTAFIGLGLTIALSPLPIEQPKSSPKPPKSITAQVHAEKVEPTPMSAPTLTPTPIITWQDNPNQCNEQTQWIAAESPFACIDKPQPVQTVTHQQNVAYRPAVAPPIAGSHQDWMTAAGIPASVWSCASTLIERESNWDVYADNPTSDAYGIPQALPGEKMASAGADWRTNPVTQLRWMHGYVNGRYGGFCQALSHSYSVGWY